MRGADHWVCPGCGQPVLDSDVREHAGDCDFIDGQGRALPTQVYLAHFRDGVEELDATSLEHACRLAETQASDANPLVLVETEDGDQARQYKVRGRPR